MRRLYALLALLLAVPPLAAQGACSATPENQTGSGGTGQTGGGGEGAAGSGGFGPGSGGGPSEEEPKTCEQAAEIRSYIGCDFWPTVVGNCVWSVFDYAVVVANAGDEPAEFTVTRAGQEVAKETVPPNQLRTVYLPWVPELKGDDMDVNTVPVPMTASVRVEDGAYHLVSSRPVTVYQFNALEYAPQGGPPGKDWSSCPSSSSCYSYSNDASLLLPSTAFTGNYRITGYPGWSIESIPPYIAVTATQDNTTVNVKLSAQAAVSAGDGVNSAGAGGLVTLTLQAGEVAELVGTGASDFSGSLVQADKPVQVISGMQCVNIPEDQPACDHIEESVFPAETLGRHYVVTVPTGPSNDGSGGHLVRLYGNVDGTSLTYPGGGPSNVPASIDAGQVVDLGIVTEDFEIVGDHEFGVASFQLGATIVDPQGQRGDPAHSLVTAVEQYRKKYVFLAPADYDVNYLDVVMPMDATVTLDGAPLGVTPTELSSGFGVARVQLGPGNGGAHLLESSAPVGIQVLGYGSFTSYQYPGGLNLETIAPPPEDAE